MENKSNLIDLKNLSQMGILGGGGGGERRNACALENWN